jgi:CBS domain-containing protein
VQGRLVGVLSTTDILAATAESDPERQAELLDELPVGMLMSRRALAIAPDAELREALRQLLHGGVRRLFVVEHGRPVGVVSSTDVVRALATRELTRAR